MRRPWAQEETERLESLLASNTSIRDIAAQLNRSLDSVRGKLEYMRMTPHQRSHAVEMRRINRRSKAGKNRSHPRAEVTLEGRPAPELLAERDVRFAAPMRDLAGFVFRDPPIGYSALDQR